MPDTLVIDTTMGATFLGQKNVVPVRINNRVYTLKNAEELRPGDMVIYEKQFVRKALDEIEPHLMESSRYVAAKNALFERNSYGRYIPRLRCDLWRGFYRSGAGEAPEKKILLESGDFAEEEYDALVDAVYGAIGGDSAPVVRTTVRNWAEGRTIAPHSKEVYSSLAGINPVFSQWHRSFHPDGDFMHLYDLYVRINQGVMRYISSRKGAAYEKEYKAYRNQGNPISLAPEIKGVLKYVVDEVNEQYVVARVTEVKRAGRGRNSRVSEKFEPHLAQGVYHKSEPPLPGIKIKDMRELRADQMAIETILLKCIRDYLPRKIKKIENAYPLLFVDVDNKILHGLSGSKIYADMFSRYASERSHAAEEMAAEFLGDAKSGEAEELLELPYGTLQESGDTLRAINAHFPPPFFEYVKVLVHLRYVLHGHFGDASNRHVKKLRSRLKDLSRVLRARYGFEDFQNPAADKILLTHPSGRAVPIDLSSDKKSLKTERMRSTLDDYGIAALEKYCDDKSLVDYEMKLAEMSGIQFTVFTRRL